MYVVTGYANGQVAVWPLQNSVFDGPRRIDEPFMVADWSGDVPVAVMPLVAARAAPGQRETLVGVMCVTKTGRLRLKARLPDRDPVTLDKPLPMPEEVKKRWRWIDNTVVNIGRFDAQFRYLITASGTALFVWQLPSPPDFTDGPTFVACQNDHMGNISALAFSNGDQWVLSGGADEQVNVSRSMELLRGPALTVLRRRITHEGHNGAVIQLAAGGGVAYSLGGPSDGRLRTWKLSTTSPLYVSPPISEDLTCMRVVMPLERQSGLLMFGTGAGDLLYYDGRENKTGKVDLGFKATRIFGVTESVGELVIVTETGLWYVPREMGGKGARCVGASQVPVVCTNL